MGGGSYSTTLRSTRASLAGYDTKSTNEAPAMTTSGKAKEEMML